MLIGIPAETTLEERRVAASPETVKKFVARGHAVRLQRGAGMHAGLSDEQYSTAGAELSDDTDALAAQLVLGVWAPTRTELTKLRSGTALVAMLDPFDAEGIAGFARAGRSGSHLRIRYQRKLTFAAAKVRMSPKRRRSRLRGAVRECRLWPN